MGRRTKVAANYLLVTLVTITSLIAAVNLPAEASAAEANGFQISPVLSEITIDKGQSQTVPITVTNPTDVVSNDQVVVDDFTASTQENGTPNLLLNGQVADPRHNFKSLVDPIPNISIPPKGTASVEVTLSVPPGANSGGYYGTVRIVPVTSGNGNGNVGLTASVGTLFLVTVPGNLIEKLDLVQLSAAHNNQASSLLFSGTPQVLTRLSNVGDIQVQPFGRVNVTNMFGKVVASYEFNNLSPRSNILPNSIRKFIDKLPKQNWLGHYTIEESLAYTSGSGNLINDSVGFWYLPIWSIAVLVVALFIIVAIVYKAVLRFKKPAHRR
ncbi:MAG TPA: DUF916 domain-containing protein [Candidatus Binatia bacterium]|nr:DUF916 domain-containing protein [Candidatus Binatia bacterium]